MWRAATLRKLTTRPLATHSPCLISSVGVQKRHQSSSMENAETLEDVMKSIREQMDEDDARRAIENPTPWFSLLHYPSRAAWRSTDHIMGVQGQESDLSSKKQASSLSQTQFNLLQHSERTNKQLKRTYLRIMETHNSLATKRERERRLAANLSKPSPTGIGDPDGARAIADGKGRHVGSWRDKKEGMAAPASLCDDPSVALALSMGLSGSKFGTDADGSNELNGGTSMTVKSAKSANKLAKLKGMSPASSKERPVGYGPEQTLTHLRYRLGPNYSIVKRVLSEVQSLLGGKPYPEDGSSSKRRQSFQPKRVLDFGSGVGSSSAAALDVFGVNRGADSDTNGIDWIHSIDASKSMRDATEKVLKSMLESAPWERSEEMQTEEEKIMEEELAEYERMVKEIRGEDVDPRRLERQRKRMAKWEQTWNKQTNALTRLTFGESIVDASSFYSDRVEVDKDDRPALPWQQQLDEQRRKTIQKKAKAATTQYKGSFDLITCSYTLSELPNVPSSLAAASLLWEKLAPNGVIVFVEPGTPDGFGILRSVRSMLLECCPPPEIKERRRRAAAAMENNAQEQEAEDNEDSNVATTLSGEEDIWPEECHVIAPCTHNGTCPMSRHQRNHIKRNTRFGKYEADEPAEDEGEATGEEGEEEEEEGGSESMLEEWEGATEEEKEEIKMMLTDGQDVSDEEVVEMIKYMDSMEDDDDDDDDDAEEESDSDDDDDDDVNEDEKQFYNIDGETNNEPSSKSSSMAKKTDVFDTAFCSFVHQFPGGTSRKKGEKFTYLVLQKRVPDDSKKDNNNLVSEQQESLVMDEVDVVEMLSKSVHHAQKLKEEDLRKRVQQKFDRNNAMNGYHYDSEETTYHKDQSHDVLQKAVEVEGEYLNSTLDKLGLEMLYGDERRKGWGRLIRAPLKRKGHVLLDYCSAGCGGCSKNGSSNNDDLPDGTQGRITRQKVSRGWSARAAPGCYSASRKARWGGLWPDLLERIKHVEREDESRSERKNAQKE